MISNESPAYDRQDLVADKVERATETYQKVWSQYKDLAEAIGAILERAFTGRNIQVHSINTRAKSTSSFRKKAAKLSSVADEYHPKYEDPLTQITDLAGVRVITYFPRTTSEVDRIINDEFEVIERIDKAEDLHRQGRLGYQSVHYVVKLKRNRTALSEYTTFGGLVAEIQVRTILQHAWAEIEHDIQYKSVETIPSTLRQRFISLAGLLEIADREFQAIQDEDERLRQAARKSVEQGRLETVEITADALRAYLDKKLGSDARMADWSYEFAARELIGLGFRNFQQIDKCIAPYDDDHLSRLATRNRQGQITRFELMLLASMGEYYISQHTFGDKQWFVAQQLRYLNKIKQAGIEVGQFHPRSD